MSKYSDNPNKKFIRKTIDITNIKLFVDNHQKDEGLYYFGMPSENIADIRDWKQYISKVDVVEIIQKNFDKMCQLLSLLGLGGSRYRCDIQDLILNYPNEIKGYDLINLDFIGHFITHRRLSKRLNSINKLIAIQKSRGTYNFLMIMTYKAAHGVGRRILNEFLTDCENSVDRVGNNAKEIFDWARKPTTKQYEKLFILVPILIISYGGNFSYNTICHEIVFYYGKTRRSPMAHFIFEFSFTGKSIPLIDSNRFKPIPLKKIKEVENNEWRIHQSDMPEFKEDIKCSKCNTLIPFQSIFCLNCGNRIKF